MVRGKKRTERIRHHLLSILETRDEPMSARELSYVLESQTRLRCGVHSIGNVFRPLVSSRKIRRVKPMGMKVYTYELIKASRLGE